MSADQLNFFGPPEDVKPSAPDDQPVLVTTHYRARPVRSDPFRTNAILSRDGRVLKEEGMDAAAASEAAQAWLVRARAVARDHARKYMVVCADDVRKAMPDDPPPNPAVCGSLFRGSEWAFTGGRNLSTHPENHAREQKVWRLRTN